MPLLLVLGQCHGKTSHACLGRSSSRQRTLNSQLSGDAAFWGRREGWRRGETGLQLLSLIPDLQENSQCRSQWSHCPPCALPWGRGMNVLFPWEGIHGCLVATGCSTSCLATVVLRGGGLSANSELGSNCLLLLNWFVFYNIVNNHEGCDINAK